MNGTGCLGKRWAFTSVLIRERWHPQLSTAPAFCPIRRMRSRSCPRCWLLSSFRNWGTVHSYLQRLFHGTSSGKGRPGFPVNCIMTIRPARTIFFLIFFPLSQHKSLQITISRTWRHREYSLQYYTCWSSCQQPLDPSSRSNPGRCHKP